MNITKILYADTKSYLPFLSIVLLSVQYKSRDPLLPF